ncbi:MAG: hypothetical protein ACI9LM_001922 [Alteromonadaceae bacterium]|jgi:hypothetical protein
MKNLLLIAGLLIMILHSTISQASIIKVDIELDKVSYQQDDIIYAQLVVRDFSQALGGFFSMLNFQSNNLSLLDWQFGAGFDDGLTYEKALTNSLYLEEYSWASTDENTLKSFQGSQFTLASFSFKALTAGTHLLSFEQGSSGLLDFDFGDVVAQFSGTSILVADNTSTPVPEPKTLALFFGGLLLLQIKRKKVSL